MGNAITAIKGSFRKGKVQDMENITKLRKVLQLFSPEKAISIRQTPIQTHGEKVRHNTNMRRKSISSMGKTDVMPY